MRLGMAGKRLSATRVGRLALLFTACGISFASQTSAQTASGLTITCTAPAFVFAGSSASISCSGVSDQHRPLTYAFSATAGSLTPHTAMAVLSVAGVASSQVTVTATVRDDHGASATQKLTLAIRQLPQIAEDKIPPKPTPGLSGGAAPAPAIHAEPLPILKHAAAPPPPPPAPVAVAPAAPVTAAPVQAAVPTPVAPAAHPASGGDTAIVNWVNSLPYGHITDNIASFPAMRLNVPYTVTVTIGGSDVSMATPADGSTPAPLKVSKHMDVELTSAGSPDDFTIVPVDAAQNPRLIVSDASTTWSWTVTPKNLGQLKLDVAAYVLFGDKQENRVSYETYNRSVTVKSVTLGGYLKDGLEYVLENPGASLKYILPGGGGATIIALIIAWWRKRKNSGAAKTDDKSAKAEDKA